VVEGQRTAVASPEAALLPTALLCSVAPVQVPERMSWLLVRWQEAFGALAGAARQNCSALVISDVLLPRDQVRY
jgi:hypothetical protein